MNQALKNKEVQLDGLASVVHQTMRLDDGLQPFVIPPKTPGVAFEVALVIDDARMVFDRGRFPSAYDEIIRRLRQSGHGQEACPEVVGLVADIDKEVRG